MHKIIIAGGREFNDYSLLKETLDNLFKGRKDIEIVSGKARGADSLGERYANENELSISSHEANWNLHGKSAGYKRNAEMAEYADILIAFWDGESKGTKHMIDLAKRRGLKVRVIMY